MITQSLEFTPKFTFSGFSSLMNRQNLFVMIFIFVFYVAVAQIGFALNAVPTVIVPVAGLAIALLFIYGLQFAPIIFLGALASYLLNHASPGTLIVLPLAQTIQALVGAYILQRFRFNLFFNRLRDVLEVMFVSFVASTIVPTMGFLAIYFNVHYFGRNASAITWSSWWVGMMTSILIVTPFVVRWLGKPRMNHRTMLQLTEAICALTSLVVIDYFLFMTKNVQILGISLVYILLIPFFWVALRVGPRFMTLALFVTTVIGIAGVFFGAAAPGATLVSVRLFQVEIFLNIFAVIFFILVAVEEERKEAIRALNGQVTQLEKALDALHSQEQVKSEFLAILAHELRNPLAPLLSSLEVLKLQGLVDERGDGVLKIMGNQMRRIKRLLDDLLDIARITQRKLTIEKKTIDINSVITNSAQSVQSIIDRRKQHLVVDVPTETIMLDGDTTRLEQACINLLNNASKFSGEGTTIWLGVTVYDGRVEIRVRDEGIGIEPQFIENIFEPFHQGKSAGANDGMGIGLTLAKNIVEMHGGTLRVQSKGKGQGSECIISLPILSVIEGSYPEEIAPEIASPSKIGKYRVLVVDDNVPAAQGMATLLNMKGYLAEPAFDGAETRQKMQSFEPHAVVLDIGLPDTDGYTLARYLRNEVDFKGPLIALTGYGLEEDRKQTQEAGFNHHLVKPVGIADLHNVLAQSL